MKISICFKLQEKCDSDLLCIINNSAERRLDEVTSISAFGQIVNGKQTLSRHLL